MAAGNVLRSDFSRMFLINNRAGPAAAPQYDGLMKAGRMAANQGNPTRVRIPDPNQYGQFLTIGIIPGDPDLPELPVTRRYTTDLSTLFGLANSQCDFDAQVHMGACKNPQDFNRGWEKVIILEAAHVQRYGTSDAIGALEPRDRVIVNEEATLQGENMYEVVPLNLTETAQTTVTREIIDVAICDSLSCGADCGTISDGCQRVFMLSVGAGGSPGTTPDIIFTQNGGGAWSKTHVQSATVGDSCDALGCVGDNLVVPCSTEVAIHYANIQNILDGVDSWTKITTGFVASHGPTCVFVGSPNAVFFGGKAGYIYFTTDPTSGVTVQSNGSLTVQDFSAINGIDDQHVLLVGKSNTVVVTNDGGDTWQSITGPSVGNDLTACQMVTNLLWWVGDSAGNLYSTQDGGAHWVAKGFPGQSSGKVWSIAFPTRSVGYLAYAKGSAGYLYRTLDGGGHWYLLPEGPGSIPANQRVEKIVACNVNHVFGGGLSSGGTDGFAMIAAV